MDFLFFWKMAAILLALGYAGLMAAYFFGWKKLAVFGPDMSIKLSRKISIIIAARNEELNILNCLNSIQKNNYPKDFFEIIVIDDFSEDNTVQLVESQAFTNVFVIKLKDFITDRNALNSFKKKALVKNKPAFVRYNFV